MIGRGSGGKMVFESDRTFRGSFQPQPFCGSVILLLIFDIFPAQPDNGMGTPYIPS